MSTGAYQATVNGNKVYCVPYFHVGYVMITINNVNPSTYYGGTWKRIAQGKTLIGVDETDTDFSTVSKTGGSKTHTLSFNTSLGWDDNNFYIASPSGAANNNYARTTVVNNGYIVNFASYKANPQSRVHWTENETVNKLQPYLTVYFWQKTAD